MLLSMCFLLSNLHISLSADFTYYIEEGKSPGTLVGDIAADTHLLDSVLPQDHNLIRFSQMDPDIIGSDQLFRVSRNSGKLYTAQTLDAESICIRKEECFRMVDVAVRKGESFVQILEIKVIVKDINDNKPEFPSKKVTIQFSEESPKSAKRAIPNAVDKDVGVLNSQVNYQLKKNKNEPFTLSVSKNVDDITKLDIILEERLDRETKDSYVIQVIAKDGGAPPLQNSLTVHISVIDVNDNTPTFSQSVYNVSINYKHDISKPICILSARDSDLNKHREITYHFNSQTSSLMKTLFELNEITGEIFLKKKFTFGQKTFYKLYVEATDGGIPPLSSTAKVLVNVINQQNNPPVIDVNFVSVSTGDTARISEDIEVGSFIAYVKVSDHDEGLNGEVKCNLHHEKFLLQRLGTKKYKVTVKSPLNREANDHHDIIISCQDKGMPPLRTVRRISIKVMDINDINPKFAERTFKFFVYENQRSKFPVGYVNATDPDLGLGGKLTYSLIDDKKHFLPFQISENGLISTLVSLDHEFQDVYKFQVLVKDNGIPSLNNTANVIIEVRDKNDNIPYFIFPSVNPYSIDIVYYLHQTKNITTLKAADRDSRENAFLRFEILRGNNKKLFALNQYSGLLTFSRKITQEDTGSYHLAVMVKDNGIPTLNQTTNLTLFLTVSNKTYDMFSDSQKPADQKVHMFLMIAIVLVSMTVSVPITAVMAVCFVRCRNRRNDVINPCNKHANEQRHLMCPSRQEVSWTDADQTSEMSVVRMSQELKSRKGIYPGDQLDRSRKGAGVKEVIYQEIDGEEREQRLSMICASQNDIVSSDTDDGWSDGDIGRSKQLAGQGFSECCKSRLSIEDRHRRPISKRFSCPQDVNTINRSLKTSNIGHIPDCTQWIDLRPTIPDRDLSDFPPQLPELPHKKH